ncbi:MAG: hypothetical protein ACLRZ5_16765 [Ruminococcus sp.]
MVDIFLMHSLLLLRYLGTRIILVGDENQLPSVGLEMCCGILFKGGVFPVVELEENFQAGLSQ